MNRSIANWSHLTPAAMRELTQAMIDHGNKLYPSIPDPQPKPAGHGLLDAFPWECEGACDWEQISGAADGSYTEECQTCGEIRKV